MIGNAEFIQSRSEALNRLSVLTDHCSRELMTMHDKAMDAKPQENNSPCMDDIYRIGAALDMIARQIETESEWYNLFLPKAARKQKTEQMPDSFDFKEAQ